MLSLGAILPLATNYSEASHQKQRRYKKRGWKGVKKYSKRWWQLYRAQERRKRAIAARKRALAARQERLAQQRENGDNSVAAKIADRSGKAAKENSASSVIVLPSGEAAPAGWKRGQDSKNELQFRVNDEGGRQLGSASLSVVGPAMGEDHNIGRHKTLAGVSTSALRRTVIDRMMKEEGWVVNDYHKDLGGGKKIYVVVAQSRNQNGQILARNFYFTEYEGRIYSLATNAPNESAERLAQESEKVINSLQKANRSAERAELR
jgi:hypothetical protein